MSTGTRILSARRSAVVPRAGAFAGLEFHQIAAPVIAAALADAGLAPDDVDEIIVGNALGAGGNPARSVVLAAGLPERVAGLSIDRQCVSGLDAILLGDAMIRAGQARVVIAGGVESYSRRPLRSRVPIGGSGAIPYDQAPFTPWANRDPDMTDAADHLARMLDIDRAAQEGWAIQSHRAALAARDALRAEIVPVAGVRDDPFARRLTPALCARAKPLAGSITAATTSVAADGAGFVVLTSDTFAPSAGGPDIRLAAGRTLGGAPDLPGVAPIAAIGETLGQAGITPDDLDLAEIMEAYAVQAIACVQGAGLPTGIVNGKGGSLARGHPIGASGAICAVRVWQDLAARGGGIGLAAIAAAGGLGTAVLLRGA